MKNHSNFATGKPIREGAVSSVESTEKPDLKTYWDQIYEGAAINRLGWYEAFPEPSLRLIEACRLPKDAVLLQVGAGATTLVDALLKLGYQHIIANDISSVALDKLEHRLGKKAAKVSWIVDDLVYPRLLQHIEAVDLWHDRAVLHFLTTQSDQDRYFALLKSLVRPGGFVILATFNLQGATRCSGLPVFRYDQNMLAERLGDDFELIQAFDYKYTMPSGDTRAYIYTLFQRK